MSSIEFFGEAYVPSPLEREALALSQDRTKLSYGEAVIRLAGDPGKATKHCIWRDVLSGTRPLASVEDLFTISERIELRAAVARIERLQADEHAELAAEAKRHLDNLRG